jgi:MinD superfamily P-loop ATPase
MTITVASGKGGAGKTSVSAALAAALGPTCAVADCDVDAANIAIALGARVRERENYSAGPGFFIDGESCSGCGLCQERCRFDAIRSVSGSKARRIVEELCERCGACFDLCPVGAVKTEDKKAGELFVSDSRIGASLVHAELAPGEDTSGKLAYKVRKRAESLAGSEGFVIVDAPPGIGCPVIASLSGCDLVLVVVEASVSGIRDAARLIELVSKMKRKSTAVINKTGLDAEMDGRARSMLSKAGVSLIGEIPFDASLRSAEESSKTWIDVEGEAGDKVRMAVASARREIETGGKA